MTLLFKLQFRLNQPLSPFIRFFGVPIVLSGFKSPIPDPGTIATDMSSFPALHDMPRIIKTESQTVPIWMTLCDLTNNIARCSANLEKKPGLSYDREFRSDRENDISRRNCLLNLMFTKKIAKAFYLGCQMVLAHYRCEH